MRVTLTSPAGQGSVRTHEEAELSDGASAADLLTMYGIDPRTCVVVVNGTAATRGTQLRDGDQVRLYPVQAGG